MDMHLQVNFRRHQVYYKSDNSIKDTRVYK